MDREVKPSEIISLKGQRVQKVMKRKKKNSLEAKESATMLCNSNYLI